MTNSATVTVEGYNFNKDKNYYSLKLDDLSIGDEGWVNGELTEKVTKDVVSTWKGQKVNLKLNNTGSFIDIKEVELAEQGPNNGSKAEGAANHPLSKQDRIKAQVAFKEACETVRHQKSSGDIDEHFEQVNSLANGYRQILDKQFEEEMEEADNSD